MITLPKSDLKKQEILSKIAERFELGKKYKGVEVAEIIRSFDVDDYTLFRRELINFGYFERNPYLEEYILKKKKLSLEELEKIGNNQKNINEL